MGVPLSVLLVEHSERDASFVLAKLRSGGYEPQCERVETPAGLATALERQPWDLITCEYVLPEFSAAAALQLIRDRGLDVPVILVCNALDEGAAVALMKAGAHDYVSKHDLTRLLPAIQRELREAEERRARRRAEAALRESELRFANAFTHAPIGMALVETDGKVQRVNRALCQMLGYSEEELLTMRVWAITHADDIAVTFDQALRLINGELDAWHLEKRFLHKQGHWIWALTSSSLVRGPDGYPAYVISQVQDITARKRAQAAQRNEVRVSAALARVGRELIASLDTPNLLDRLCRVTADVLGCDASHTLFWQPEENVFRPIAGYGATPEEEQVAQVIRVPRAALADLLARLEKDDVTQVGVIPSHVLSGAEQQRLGVGRPLCMALRRGTDLIGLQVAVVRGRHKPFRKIHLRIARGIAQAASLALEHARVLSELDRANHLKSDFVATMSHELRTPLSVMIGYTDLLLEGAFGPVTADQVQSLARMRTSSYELLELINATLDLSRLEAGQVPLQIKAVAIHDLLREVDAETRDLQRRSGLQFVWNVAPDLPQVHTDPLKLKLVLKNLIGNAVKFTDRGTVSVEAHANSGGLGIAVADTGIGIPAEALAIIFEPFRQADSSQTRRHGGVGLGLYIVQRLIEMLGGTVAVESTVGSGSTFRISLRADQRPVSSHGTSSRPDT